MRSGIWWRHGPLITEDAGCVAHVIWRNGALLDTKGNSWTQNGTVPQAAAVGSIPPGAGPFSDANYYSLGAGPDVLDFGGNFTMCVVFLPAAAGTLALFGNGDGATAGYRVLQNTTKLMLFSDGGGGNAQSANSVVQGTINVGCVGVSGGNFLAALNSGSTATVPATITQDSTSLAKIGRVEAAGAAFTGRIGEVYFSTTAASGALFAALITQAFKRMRLPIP
jgi:hypothetical protein